MNILITGGTGFLGKELLKRLTGEGNRNIKVVARNEGNLISLQQKYPYIETICGDISDPCIVKSALKDVDTLYHLAAFKHVGLAELQPYQCAMSNVVGTINLLKYFKGKTFVSISTDKVAKISGVYGATKYTVERLVYEASLTNCNIHYVIPRYGNVIGSTGSVIPKWIEAAKFHKEITITDPKATRFFFTVQNAVQLIYEAVDKCDSGLPYIKKMKSCTIDTLAAAIVDKYGHFDRINYIGLQQGENMHEYLDDDYNSRDAKKFTVNELIEMI